MYICTVYTYNADTCTLGNLLYTCTFMCTVMTASVHVTCTCTCMCFRKLTETIVDENLHVHTTL